MIARILSQFRLPLLPAQVAEIAPGDGLTAGKDGGPVIVHGSASKPKEVLLPSRDQRVRGRPGGRT